MYLAIIGPYQYNILNYVLGFKEPIGITFTLYGNLGKIDNLG